MFKLMLTFKRKDGLSRQDFIDYYEQQHEKLVRKILPPLEVYRRNYIVTDDPLFASMNDGRSAGDHVEPPFDVITEAIYSSREAAKASMEALFDGETRDLIFEDESKFVHPGSIKFYIIETHQSSIPW